MGFVYQLKFPNGKCYIGITIKPVLERFYHHKYALNYQGGRSTPLYNAWRKYGDPVVSTLLETVDEILPQEERRLIAELNTFVPYGYNATLGGEATLGYRHSDEVKQKMSKLHIGIPHPNKGKPIYKLRGRIIPEEQRVQIAKTLKGVKHSADRIEKMRQGRLATYARLRELGIPSPRVGMRHSDEAKQKISAANSGRKMGAKHRVALSAGAKAYHMARRLERALDASSVSV